MRLPLTLALLALLCGGMFWLAQGSDRRTAPVSGIERRPGAAEPAERPAVLTAPGALPSPATESNTDARGREVERGSGAAPVRDQRRFAADPDGFALAAVDMRGDPVAGLGLSVRTPASGMVWKKGITDDGGRLTLRRAELERSAGAPDTVVVESGVHGREPQVQLVQLVPEGDCEVRIADFGSVEVRVTELDGRPAADGTRVELTLVLPEEAHDPLLASERPTREAETRSGSVLFPFVELGQGWEAFARHPGSDVPTRLAALGPTRLRERVVLELVIGVDHPVYVLRAVDGGGQPYADTELSIAAHRWFGYADRSTLRTDAEGRFPIDLHGARFMDVKSIVASVSPEASGADEELAGRALIPNDLEPGGNDGGDVVLAPLPVLVAGRVVDSAGRPVSGADVGAGVNGIYAGLGGAVRGASDAQGRFRLRGFMHEEEFGVRAEANGMHSPTLEVTEGVQGLELRIEGVFAISGSFLAAEEMPFERLQMRLFLVGSEEPLPLQGEYQVDSEGAFTQASVPAGVYDLAVFLGSFELARVKRLRVDGDTTLDPFDLRDLVFLHRLELVPPAGADTPAGEVHWRASGTDDDFTRERFEGDRIDVLALAREVDVWVRPAGLRHVSLERVSGRERVSLSAPLVCRLVLRTTGQMPSYPYLFDPVLYKDGVNVGQPEGPAYFTDANRELVFLVSEPGRVRVGWHLERRGENWSVGGNVLDARAVEIDVLDAAGEQVFDLELDGDALTGLMETPPW